ncbi:MAG: hypothetical protein NTZ55_04345 [Candidatus Roizmanbacteria bacterium]|nr:hypothetical protein [Candidatus Roizmanbacteria bacterium]
MGEAGYYYYLCKQSHTSCSYTNLYSLRTVTEAKNFTNWLTKNTATSSISFQVDEKNTPIIIVHTSGNIMNLVVDNTIARFSLKRDKALINFNFPIKAAEVFNDQKSGISLSATTLKENETILVHEVFTFQDDKVVPLNVRLVRNWETKDDKSTGGVQK